MLDLKFIRQNPDAIRKAIELKRVDLDLAQLIEQDEITLGLKKQLQELETQRNANAKKIPQASAVERPPMIETGRKIGREIEELKPQILAAEEKLQNLLWLVPNIPSPDAPIGKSEEDNVEIRRQGTPTTFTFSPLDHVQILDRQHWAELDRIAKISGSRSYALTGDLVLLEQACLRFALETLKKKGFKLITVPAMARETAFYGTGHFPTGREQAYHLPADDLYLAGTAEVLINSLHSGEILKESDLPLLYGGISPCFRREAGSSGKDVRGLMRVHQFQKVEQFVLCKNDPAESARWHEFLLKTSEEIVQALELPYRIVECCTGDMGAGKFRMFDIETWVPSEKRYRETHSCSSLHEWQARRTDLRYRDTQATVRFCHTLNNTAIATPRILIPLLENHQQADGTIKIPAALRPYLDGASQIGSSS